MIIITTPVQIKREPKYIDVYEKDDLKYNPIPLKFDSTEAVKQELSYDCSLAVGQNITSSHPWNIDLYCFSNH